MQLHQSLRGIQGNISRIGNVGAEYDGVKASIQLEDVDLLTEGVGHEQLITDPVDGDGHR